MPTADDLIRDIEKQSLPGTVLSRDVPLTSSPRFITFAGLYSGSYDRYANPDSISISTYNQMRFHGVIRAGLILIKAPILSCIKRATVQCSDPKIKKFVEHYFIESGLLYRLAQSSLRAVEFGVAFHEKVWDVEDIELTYQDTDPDTGEVFEDTAWSGPAHYISDFRDVNPETVTFVLRDPKTRQFAAFVQAFAPTWIASSGDPAQATPAEILKLLQKALPPGVDLTGISGIPILAQKAFVYTHEMEFGNLWGTSRLRAVYPYFFWAQVMLKYWMAWAERKIVPTRIVRHPVGRAPDGTDYSDLAVTIAAAIDDVSAVAVPNVRQASAAGSTWRGGDFEWIFEEVATTDKAETFKLIKDDLETAMLRAMFVPERTFTTGQGFGLFSTDAQAHTDTFLMTEDAEAASFIDTVNKEAILPLVVDNFGADAEKATIEIPGITDEHREMLREILTGILTNPDVASTLDIRAILEQLGVPIKDLEDSAPPGAPGAAPEAGAPMPGTPPGAPESPNSALPPAAGVESQATPQGAVPANLVLESDDDALALETFDPSRWDVSPDPKALNGYRVMDKSTGQRISGFAAQQVVIAFQNYAKSQGKKGAAAAKTAANKAAAAAKKSAADAQRLQKKAEADAKRAAAQGTAAAKKQAASSKHEAAQAAAAQKKQATAAKQQSAAQQRAAKQQTTAQKKQTAQQVQQQKQLAQSVKAEKNTLQAQTSKLDPKAAAQLLQQNGFTVNATVDSASYNSLVQQATSAAAKDPNSTFTIVKANNALMLVSKPNHAITPTTGAAAATNVALAASGGHASGRVDDELLTEAQSKIAKLLRRRTS